MAEKPEKPAPAAKVVAEVQKNVDVEAGQGFRGVEVDQTDNHAYTVAGVSAGEPTPEGPHADKAPDPVQ